MRLLRLHVLFLGVSLSAAGGDEPQGCVITEIKNVSVTIRNEKAGKAFYLWSGPSLSSVALVLLLRNESGANEVVKTVNLKTEIQLLPRGWNKIEFPAKKTNDSVSILANNVTRIQWNCSSCSLKELQIQVEESSLFAFNCSNSTSPPALFADHWEAAGSAETTQNSGKATAAQCASNEAWKISLLLLLPICFLSIFRNIHTSMKRRRRSAGETGRRQEDNLPLVSLGAQNLPLVSPGAQNLPLVSPGAQDLPPPVPPRFFESPPEGAMRRERGMRARHDAPQLTESENVYEDVPEGVAKATFMHESVNSIYGAFP